MGKVADLANTGKELVTKGVDGVTSSGVWNALKSSKTAVHGAAGGGLGLVGNAGYNYSSDSSGGYMGAALAGAAGGAAISTAWRAGGKELAHTAAGKVKSSVATRGGTKSFNIRNHPGEQHVVTDKNGNLDMTGQLKFISDTEDKLKNMSATDVGYSSLLKQREEGYKGLDHMNSLIDNRLSQTLEGSKELNSKYTDIVKKLDNTQERRDWQEHDALKKRQRLLKNQQRLADEKFSKAQSAFDSFKGDRNSDEGKKLQSALTTAQAIKKNASENTAGFYAGSGVRLKELDSTMKSPTMKQFKSNYGQAMAKLKASESLIEKHQVNNGKHVLNTMATGLGV